MKKITLLLAVSVSLFFTQCKKDAASTTDTTEVTTSIAGYTVTAQNTLNVESLKALSSQPLKRIAYGLMSPIEKYLVWAENIKTASVNFTPQQKLLTLEYINFLTPQLFSKPDLGKAASFRDQWLAKANKIFTNDQIRAIAYQIFPSTDVSSTVAVNGYGGGVKTCECNAGSEYTCDRNTYCPENYDNGVCKDPSAWGCGFSALWACDNKCSPGVNPNL